MISKDFFRYVLYFKQFHLKVAQSKKVFRFDLNLQNGCQITTLSTIKMLSDLASVFGDLSKSEKLSDIKSPLAVHPQYEF